MCVVSENVGKYIWFLYIERQVVPRSVSCASHYHLLPDLLYVNFLEIIWTWKDSKIRFRQNEIEFVTKTYRLESSLRYGLKLILPHSADLI